MIFRCTSKINFIDQELDPIATTIVASALNIINTGILKLNFITLLFTYHFFSLKYQNINHIILTHIFLHAILVELFVSGIIFANADPNKVNITQLEANGYGSNNKEKMLSTHQESQVNNKIFITKIIVVQNLPSKGLYTLMWSSSPQHQMFGK